MENKIVCKQGWGFYCGPPSGSPDRNASLEQKQTIVFSEQLQDFIDQAGQRN
jgi:hypothetical protein